MKLSKITAIGCLSVTLLTSTAAVVSAQEIRSGPVYNQALKIRDGSPAPSLLKKIEVVEDILGEIEKAKDHPLEWVINQVFGKVRRSCSGYIAVANARAAAKVGEEFVSRRSAGATVPNRARRRARDGGQHCMKAHFDDPRRGAYTACMTHHGIIGYNNGTNLQQEINEAAKRIARRGEQVDVVSVTHGNRGCGRNENRRMVWDLGDHIVQD